LSVTPLEGIDQNRPQHGATQRATAKAHAKPASRHTSWRHQPCNHCPSVYMAKIIKPHEQKEY
jgi:hypothetical protein